MAIKKNSKDLNVNELKVLGRRIIELEKKETELKRIQDTLGDTNEFLASLIETAPSAIVSLDTEMRIMTWNPAAERIFGWKKEEVLGGFLPFVPEEKRAESLAIHQSALQGKDVPPSKVRRFRKDGLAITISVSPRVLRDKNGKAWGTLAIMDDVSERKQLEADLLKEKERFRSFVEKAPLGIALISKDGTYQYINPRFTEIFGYDLKDIPTGSDWFEKAFPDLQYREKVISFWQKEVEINDVQEKRPAIFKVRCKDAQEKWIHFWPGIKVMDLDNYLVFSEDVTDRIQAEEALKRSESTLKSVLASSPVGISIVTGNRTLGWVNESMTAITGHKPEEMIGKSARMVYPTDQEFARVGEVVYTPVRQGAVGETETRWISKDGRMLDIQVFAAAIDPEDISAGVILSAVDITERKQNEELLKQIIKASPMAIFILQEGRFQMTNSQLEKFTGYTETELLEKDPTSLIHPDDRDGALLMAEKTLNDSRGTSKPYEYRAITKSGETRTFMEDLTLITFHGRKALLGNLVDITDRKLLESQLMQAQKLESIGQLAAGIAHEINTPTQFIGDNIHFIHGAFEDINTFLGKIKQQLKGAKTDNNLIDQVEDLEKEFDLPYLSDEIPKALHQASDGVERIAKIVQAMREFSHPGTKERTMVNINKAIENTITISRNEWKYIAEMITDFDPSLPMIYCLPGELNQAFLNIIINAAQALAENGAKGQTGMGTIKVATRKNDHWAEIRVSDTGPGIPEAIKSRIFDPFFTTKEVGKGTGQGLAIVHSVIVDKHQGFVWCETEVDKGSTFIIRLPLDETVMPHQGPDNTQA